MSSNRVSEHAKIPKLHSLQGFALWWIFILEVMRKDRVLHVLRDDTPDPLSSSQAAFNRFKWENESVGPQIVLNEGEEPEKLITSILLTDVSKKVV